jgi:Na+/melibiose symporter-like transporter
VWLAAEKLAFAAGALIVGVMIGLFGFVESAGGLAQPQTGRAVFGIAVTYCGVNMAIYLASILAVRRLARRPPAGGTGLRAGYA